MREIIKKISLYHLKEKLFKKWEEKRKIIRYNGIKKADNPNP